jgi:hypothetical protein
VGRSKAYLQFFCHLPCIESDSGIHGKKTQDFLLGRFDKNIESISSTSVHIIEHMFIIMNNH